MTLDVYQEQACETLLETSRNIPYLVLGLTSEAGEVAGKYKKVIRDQDGEVDTVDERQLVSEVAMSFGTARH